MVLIGREFWGGLTEWITNRLLDEGMISEKDTDLFLLCDEPEKAMRYILDTLEPGKLKPNFSF